MNISASRMSTPSGEISTICVGDAESASSLFGVPAGADPLKVVIPIFSVRSVAQSTPLVSARNIITVTLESNVDIEGVSSSYV